MNPAGPKKPNNQIPLPEIPVETPRRGVSTSHDSEQNGVKRRRISHLAILEALQSAQPQSRGVVEIYKLEVLPLKTRTLRLLGKKVTAATDRTLLGFEVQASFKRIHCPDMVTARYLKLFTELGCSSIKLPYDPTVTSRLVPELEASVNRMITGVRELFPEDRRTQLYVLRQLYRHIRNRLRSSRY